MRIIKQVTAEVSQVRFSRWLFIFPGTIAPVWRLFLNTGYNYLSATWAPSASESQTSTSDIGLSHWHLTSIVAFNHTTGNQSLRFHCEQWTTPWQELMRNPKSHDFISWKRVEFLFFIQYYLVLNLQLVKLLINYKLYVNIFSISKIFTSLVFQCFF